jgi:hypothetical protein
MTRIKNQHIVPKVYLRPFASNDTIHVLNKEDLKTFQSSLQGVGCEKYFYDIPPAFLEGTSDSQVVEKALADIDGRFAQCRDTFISEAEQRLAFTPVAKDDLVEFLAVQWLRTQVMRQVLVSIVEATSAIPGLDTTLAEMLAVPPESVSYMHARNLFHPEHQHEIKAILKSHVWLLAVNYTNMLFYTSDSPVLQLPHAHDALGPLHGIANCGTEIAWPLSPRHMLLLFERTHHNHLKEIENRVIPVSDASAHVLPYNQRQVAEAYRQVFSRDGKFDVAIELLDLNPHLRAVARPRVQAISPKVGSA